MKDVFFSSPKSHRKPIGTILLVLSATSSLAAEDKPIQTRSLTYRVSGLFSPDREDDLRQVIKKLSGLTLTRLDVKNAEATFAFDPAQLFPQAKPEQWLERLDNLLRSASSSTFGIKPLSTTPKDQLTRIEVPVAGLDCKGCCLAAYEAIDKINGVEQATVSFQEGRITALIDPARTDRAALETALKNRGVSLEGK